MFIYLFDGKFLTCVTMLTQLHLTIRTFTKNCFGIIVFVKKFNIFKLETLGFIKGINGIYIQKLMLVRGVTSRIIRGILQELAHFNKRSALFNSLHFRDEHTTTTCTLAFILVLREPILLRTTGSAVIHSVAFLTLNKLKSIEMIATKYRVKSFLPDGALRKCTFHYY